MSSTRASRKPKIECPVYLVTDSTPTILGHRDLVSIVEAAIQGGVTAVQYRDKHADTGELIATAAKLHAVTNKYLVPLIINDRVDVCLAVGAQGVHVGQDDMSCQQARQVLGPDAIIGVSVSSVAEAHRAIGDGADYLGIGTVFATATKSDTKSVIGTRGVQQILAACATGTAKAVPCVAIGGINATNVRQVLVDSAAGPNRLNGVAVVSAIVASPDPKAAAQFLGDQIKGAQPHAEAEATPDSPDTSLAARLPHILLAVPPLIRKHAASNVLCHNMTNTVVQNFSANVCLATGSSPIMSDNADEAADLARLGGALLINMGTITPEKMVAYLAGLKAYNAAGRPVVLDPVGAAATCVRRDAVRTLLAAGSFAVIKGNQSEIAALAGTTAAQQRGVDSGPVAMDDLGQIGVAETLARRERCIVLMTGQVDFLSDGERTMAIYNGSSQLGHITGSGCALGSVVASYAALDHNDRLGAVLAGVLHYEIAAEWAHQRRDCRGPGSFVPAFIDELRHLRDDVVRAPNIRAYSELFLRNIQVTPALTIE